MKHLLLFFTGLVFSQAVIFAQGDKYNSTMEAKVAQLDTSRNTAQLKDLGNTFERIANAEKDKWLPWYYAALSNIKAGYTMGTASGQIDATQTDPLADKAEEQLSKAEALAGTDNSEIFILKKMIATLRMWADPMNRYMQYGPAAEEALGKAKELNPDNPRAYLLEAQDKYYTPEQFGGSKEEAKELFEKSKELFAKEKPATPIDPHWGANQADYFLSLY